MHGTLLDELETVALRLEQIELLLTYLAEHMDAETETIRKRIKAEPTELLIAADVFLNRWPLSIDMVDIIRDAITTQHDALLQIVEREHAAHRAFRDQAEGRETA